ncbi:MAG: CocE/NonD family hydrolase [Proteobacteria bacterium]|nr:CocE/NonD family hydrolase [Pseudomonadota bacterium]
MNPKNVSDENLERGPCFQVMVPMRDGVRLNTFVFLPALRGPQFPVIVQRTPYGITSANGVSKFDCENAWLPSEQEPMRGSILRGWRNIVARGYAAVYQDTRGRNGSEGEDHVYGDDASDGYDTLDWIAKQAWSNQQVGISGSSAGATTALAAASQGHPTLRAFFAQVGGSSIYDDVVCEGGSIEMERLWLWVANNIPGLSDSHRDIVMNKSGFTLAEMQAAAEASAARYTRLEAAKREIPSFVGSPDWMRLPLTGYPDFTIWQPYLDEIISHPSADDFRASHNFRKQIEIPGFHVTTWFDIFSSSVIKAFCDIQARVGNQLLWVGPNAHYFVYEDNFWPFDPYFEWFDHWLKNKSSELLKRPPVFYSPRSWVEPAADYVAQDWCAAQHWPPPDATVSRLFLHGDGTLMAHVSSGNSRSYPYDPHQPIPTIGGRNMSIDAGPLDQQVLYDREDYGLIYRGALLDQPVTLAGEVWITLSVQSNCRDTDFIVKLIEAEANGRATLLLDGVQRTMYRDESTQPLYLEPDEIIELRISLGHIAHTFRVGSRIQVDVTSSNFPRRARNTNSGHPILANDTEADIRVATNSVHHCEDHMSFIELPVMP